MKWVTGFCPKHPFGVGGRGRRTAGRSACPASSRATHPSLPRKAEKLTHSAARPFPAKPADAGLWRELRELTRLRRKASVNRPRSGNTPQDSTAEKRNSLRQVWFYLPGLQRQGGKRSSPNAFPHLPTETHQGHTRDTSGTVQRQNRFAAAHETPMYQCFPRLLPRLYRLPHIFFITQRLRSAAPCSFADRADAFSFCRSEPVWCSDRTQFQ